MKQPERDIESAREWLSFAEGDEHIDIPDH